MKITYRPEIDGLRAIAVVAVILYHAQITILSHQPFKGGFIGFPEFKVLIKIEPGDFLLMDVHQFHCNTQIKLKRETGFRLSFVMYIREDMKECKHHKKIDGTDYMI